MAIKKNIFKVTTVHETVTTVVENVITEVTTVVENIVTEVTTTVTGVVTNLIGGVTSLVGKRVITHLYIDIFEGFVNFCFVYYRKDDPIKYKIVRLLILAHLF